MSNSTLCIILNWNGAPDTIQVAEAVISGHPADVIIADNNSTDDSRHLILKHFNAQYPNMNWIAEEVAGGAPLPDPMQLIAMEKNWGFARSINRLIQAFLSRGNYQFVWLLNNDAMPATNALLALQEEMKKNPDAGFAGSVIMDYTDPDKIQCCGLKYYAWAGVSKMLLKNQSEQEINRTQLISDFQHGASLLISLRAIERVGLMDEQFFLYFEEQDWQIRAAEKGISNFTATGSRVFHKGSQSTANAKHMFYYYYNRSAIYYSRKHESLLILTLASCGLFLLTLLRSRLKWKSVVWGIKGLRDGFRLKIYHVG